MRKFYFLTLLVFVLISSGVSAQTYVTQSGGGTKDGTSWANAYDNTQLQQAINEAESATVKQVWVAKGTYKPTENLSSTGFLTDGTTPVTDRDKAFILKTAVEIYGGFAGNEDPGFDLSLRDFTANETILSGDLNNNNVADDGDYYHVVSSRDYSKGSILDGFTIQHGFANGAASITENEIEIVQDNGGGLAIRGTYTEAVFSNLIVKNCVATNYGGGMWARGSGTEDGYVFENVLFQSNTGLRGGGVYMDVSGGTHKAQFSNCTFLNNSSTGSGASDGGGALLCANGTATRTVSVLNCLFKGNTTAAYGGAMRINSGTVNISNNTIFENGNGALRGGAIYSTGSSTVNITESTFRQNTSATGGHIYVFSGVTTVTNSTLKNGEATGSGGAVFGTSGSTANFNNTVFEGNKANNGGVFYTVSNGSFSRCKFFSNTVSGQAGALYVYTSSTSNSEVKVDNSVFYNNIANGAGETNQGGGAIYISRNAAGELSNLMVVNSTFYANKSPNHPNAGAISLNGTNNITIKLYNNIFNSNEARDVAGDIRLVNSAIMDFQNNLFQSYNLTSSGNDTFVNNILDFSPTLLFANTTYGSADFLYPIVGSFAIDKGDNNLYTDNVEEISTSKDLLGYNARLNGTIIDLGAIEYSLVLPVTISSFTAKLNNNRTNLNWSVGTESNVSHYEVERSQNGLDFSNIAMVKANGSSAYSTTDNTPSLGVNYYRLKTVDKDGSAVYFNKVQSVNVAGLAASVVAVYPNPARDIVRVSGLAQGNYSYKLVNTAGATVQQGMLDAEASINVSGLKAGMYVLQLSNGSQLKVLKK